MFELDKQQFGAFVADQRRQKQMTQKDLAQKLMISDKAVSKWERGLNMPDITLLVPLAQALDVSVAELLECRRISQSEPMSAHQVDKQKSDNDERGRSADEKAAQLEKWLAAFALFRDFSGRNRSAAALSSSDFHGVQRFISSGAAQRDLWSLLLLVRAGKIARLL
ncbi:MAG: helix-turn-helix domain-containing protein [Holdemania filiformis]